MVSRPQERTSGPYPSQDTKTRPVKGQNKPLPGGAAGAGKKRGTAMLPNTGLLSPMAPPGSPAKATITGPAAERMMATMERQAKRQKR